jgi:hypothetical protein
VDHFLDLMWEGDVPKILGAIVPSGFWQDERYYAPCPFHDDQDYCFSYQQVTRCWRCDSGCGNGDLLALAVRFWNCGVDAAIEKILALCGREAPRVVRRYPYLDAQGQFAFEILRYSPKNFSRRPPVAWVWKDVLSNNSEEGARILYRLPEVLVAREVLIVEGEKDCETARSLGLVATCNPGGSSRWHRDYVEVFRGKRVEIISDADDGGRRHARQIAGSLVRVADSVKMIEFSAVKDLTEWVEAGGTVDELLAMFWEAPALQPEDVEGWWDPNGTVHLQCGAGFLLDPELSEYAGEPQRAESESLPANETCDVAPAQAGEENNSHS